VDGAPGGQGPWGDPSYGPLGPVPDLRDGVVRLHLPEGFRYRSFDQVGGTLSDGTPIPPNHDGMAAFPGRRGDVVLVRNHEINGRAPPSVTCRRRTTRPRGAERPRSW
jgi:secreted PhoX family phosphatase